MSPAHTYNLSAGLCCGHVAAGRLAATTLALYLFLRASLFLGPAGRLTPCQYQRDTLLRLRVQSA